MHTTNPVVPNLDQALSPYPRIRQYLGQLIERRLALGPIRGSGLPSLIFDDDGSKLEDDSDSRAKLANLERALHEGEKACKGFGDIFESQGLPNDAVQADGKILDILAEVKTAEYLVDNGFTGIAHVPTTPQTKTADFIANRQTAEYAIETTRIGLPQSPRKTPKPFINTGLVLGLDGTDASPAYLATLKDATVRKCRQLEEFIASTQRGSVGIVVLSLGRDYFVSGHARRDFFLRRTLQDALAETWQSITEQGKYPFLCHLVLTRNPNSIETYPRLP